MSLTPRKYHMCSSHFVGEGQTDVIVYGGNKRRKSKFERNVMTDMMIFRFGMKHGIFSGWLSSGLHVLFLIIHEAEIIWL
jgi:hypothetical protein